MSGSPAERASGAALPASEAEIRRATLPDGRVDVKSLGRPALEAFVAPMGRARHHANQVYKWAWQRGVSSFADIPSINRQATEWLGQHAVLTRLAPADRLESADGTTKFLWDVGEGRTVESVLIPDDNRDGPPRLTLCVSTQVGCAMACSFCLTGDMGLVRNLSAAEIAGQPLQIGRSLPPGRRITNVVLMGMGEPLHNYDNLVIALRAMLDNEGLNLSHRRITVSTVGLVPRMERLAAELPVNLAVSLNASTDAQRRLVMPITRRYSLAELMAACRRLPLPAGKRIAFEYVMMAGFNDSIEDAVRVGELMQGLPTKINLIPYNENPDRDIRRPSDATVEAFRDHLDTHGVHCTVRTTRGRDISAACGQLGRAAEVLAQRVTASAEPTGMG
jgi:23S rRNA (adenine2503-C2)-methyltransferase